MPDVVIAGYGPARAATAIAAHDMVFGRIAGAEDRTGDLPVDLADDQQVRAAAQRILGQPGRCNVLVHAAAAFDRADLATVDLAIWRRVQAVNVESALLLPQAFVLVMR
jgi:NAD(P)-dependent dehydrogenase (short-subunit alcohol dehydrogenase family)